MIRSHHGRTPQIAASAYIDPQAVVIGDVTIGELSSVWPCVVIRGDVNWIRIGSRTNIQDGSILHVYKDTHPLQLGDAVTVGHGAILHGCTIESRVLIGMGAILLNGRASAKARLWRRALSFQRGRWSRRAACSWGIPENSAARSRLKIRRASRLMPRATSSIRRRTRRKSG